MITTKEIKNICTKYIRSIVEDIYSNITDSNCDIDIQIHKLAWEIQNYITKDNNRHVYISDLLNNNNPNVQYITVLTDLEDGI